MRDDLSMFTVEDGRGALRHLVLATDAKAADIAEAVRIEPLSFEWKGRTS
jgi:hypothetical protein